MLGKGVTLSSVEKGAREAQEAVGANRAEVTREEQANPSIESWVKESFGLAVAYAYVNGKVIPAVADRRREPSVLATEADPRITVANRTGQQT